MKLRQLTCYSLLCLSLVACSKKDKNGEEKSITSTLGALFSSDKKVSSQGREHLPAHCEAVVVVDFPRLRKMKAWEEEMEKSITDLTQPSADEAELDAEEKENLKKFREFLAKTKIDLKTDPGEAALCLWNLDPEQGKEPAFLLAWGGKFIPGSAMQALDDISERLKYWIQQVTRPGAIKPQEVQTLEIAGTKTLHLPEEKIYFSQAKNGAYILSNDREQFEQALTPGRASERYQFSTQPVLVSIPADSGKTLTPLLASSPLSMALPSFDGALLSFEENLLELRIHQKDEQNLATLSQSFEAFKQSIPPLPTNLPESVRQNPQIRFAFFMNTLLAQLKHRAEGKSFIVSLPITEELRKLLSEQWGPQELTPGSQAAPGLIPFPPQGAPGPQGAPAPQTAPQQ